jgi:cobalt transporter subunit CbtA
MTVRVLLAAIAAGLIAGFLKTPVEAVKVVPVIMQAETYEGGADSHGAANHVHEDGALAPSDNQPVALAETTTPEQGNTSGRAETLSLRRLVGTLLANLVTGAGFGLLMAGVSLAAGVRVTFGTGLAWGFGGWLCVQLLPAIGLPPALPGFPHADLAGRQVWWVGTVAFSVAGFWFLALYKSQWFRAVGVLLLFAPHFWGAPQPADLASDVPAYLASQYATASLATNLFFWLVLGLALGWIWDRMKPETP